MTLLDHSYPCEEGGYCDHSLRLSYWMTPGLKVIQEKTLKSEEWPCSKILMVIASISRGFFHMDLE